MGLPRNRRLVFMRHWTRSHRPGCSHRDAQPYEPTPPGAPGAAACPRATLPPLPAGAGDGGDAGTRRCVEPALPGQRDRQPCGRAPARGLAVPRPGRGAVGSGAASSCATAAAPDHGTAAPTPVWPARGWGERRCAKRARNWLKNEVGGTELKPLDPARDLGPQTSDSCRANRAGGAGGGTAQGFPMQGRATCLRVFLLLRAWTAVSSHRNGLG